MRYIAALDKPTLESIDLAVRRLSEQLDEMEEMESLIAERLEDLENLQDLLELRAVVARNASRPGVSWEHSRAEFPRK